MRGKIIAYFPLRAFFLINNNNYNISSELTKCKIIGIHLCVNTGFNNQTLFLNICAYYYISV